MSGKRPTAVSPRQKLRCAVYIYKRAQCLSWVNFGLGRAQLRDPLYLDEPTSGV
jgi:hypothetical protein